MRRNLLWLLLALIILGVRIYFNSEADEPPVTELSAGVPAEEVSPKSKKSRPSVTLRRPAPPADAGSVKEAEVAGARDALEGDELDPPADIFALDAAVREPLFELAMARIQDLAEVCAHEVPADGAQVMAQVTLDSGGLLEMELSSYDNDEESTWATDEALPEALISCLDATIWDQGWPEWEGGLAFSLTLALDAPINEE